MAKSTSLVSPPRPCFVSVDELVEATHMTCIRMQADHVVVHFSAHEAQLAGEQLIQAARIAMERDPTEH